MSWRTAAEVGRLVVPVPSTGETWVIVPGMNTRVAAIEEERGGDARSAGEAEIVGVIRMRDGDAALAIEHQPVGGDEAGARRHRSDRIEARRQRLRRGAVDGG